MELVKKNNRASILMLINEKGQVSRKDIAEATELTPAAVTMICAPLLQRGLLVETGTVSESHGAGRKRINLSLNYNIDTVLCINIGVEETFLTSCNLKGDAIQAFTLETNKDITAQEFLSQIIQEIKDKIDLEKISAVSVVLPGIVDQAEGISKHAYGIWNAEVNVRDILTSQFGKPVFLENNVKAFTLAELLYGAGRRHESFMTVKWGPGIGSAIVLDNNVYSGKDGKAGEIGHFIVDPFGKKCTCGRIGCLETKISYNALKKIKPFRMEEFGKIYAESTSAGDLESFDKAIELFAMVLTNAMSVIEPCRVILYGKMFAEDNIVQRLIEICSSLDPHYDSTVIRKTTLYNQEDYIGAVAVILKKRISGEIQ